MANVMLINPIECFEDVLAEFRNRIPGLIITGNFEQVKAMAKLGELERLCIILGGYNFSGSKFNNAGGGQTLSEAIHEAHPGIPILIWGGREWVWDDDRKEYDFAPVKNEREVYLELDEYEGDKFYQITKRFYDSLLTSADIPVRACFNMDKTSF